MKLYTSKFIENIFSNCERFGQNIGIEDIYGNKITGIEYKNKAINYALFLKDKGMKKDETIVIFIKDITKFSYIVLASLLLGAKVVIIEADYSEKILEEKLKFIKPDFLVIENLLYKLLQIPFLKKYKKINKYKSLLKYSKNIIVNSAKEKSYHYKNIDFIQNDIKSESLVVFTGGTTSTPKGVVHTLDSIQTMVERITGIIGDKTRVFYADLPHFVLIGIVMGVKTIVGENNLKNKKFLRQLEKYMVDTTFSPPYRYLDILKGENKLPHCLKHICLGSAPVYKSFLEKLFKKIGNDTKVTCIYGMTEILPVAYIDGKEKIEGEVTGDLLGKVLDGVHIECDNDGEGIISGKGLFKKYLGAKEIKNHKTGDLIEFVNGQLIMKGRKKDMILRKDYNIYPALYEPIINSIPGVIDSAMVGIWDKNGEDEQVYLFIEGNNLDKNDIIRKLKNGKYAIDTFAFPDEVVFCKIPRIGRQNKIDKNSLRSNYKQYENCYHLS